MLELRLVIGAYFLINAVILIVFGFVQPQPMKLGDPIENLNVVWGFVMLVFGVIMLLAGLADRKKPNQ